MAVVEYSFVVYLIHVYQVDKKAGVVFYVIVI